MPDVADETWQSRLKTLLGPRGYHNSMRRSLQSAVLFEANRAIEPRLQSLRPYQRKLALIDQAQYLIDSLDFLFPNQRSVILFRTMTSELPLDNETAWSRMRSILKEVEKLANELEPHINRGLNHQQAVDALVQQLYEAKGLKGEAPPRFEHSNNRTKLDPNCPVSVVNPNMHIPRKRPLQTQKLAAITAAPPPPGYQTGTGWSNAVAAPVATSQVTSSTDEEERRRAQLQEVREHLNLLKEFEGVIDPSEVAQRKRELFAALPAAPPLKRNRNDM